LTDDFFVLGGKCLFLEDVQGALAQLVAVVDSETDDVVAAERRGTRELGQ